MTGQNTTSLITLTRLRAVQHRLRALIAPLDDETCRTRFHPDLSPLGWHLGHCAYVENHWLRKVLLRDDRLTRKQRDLFASQPIHGPRGERALPDKQRLLDEVIQQQDDNILLLSGMAEALPQHPLLENEYLAHFLIQHHCQHHETMLMALNQRALGCHREQFQPQQHLRPNDAPLERLRVPAGDFPVGGEPPKALDNELPVHSFSQDAFYLGAKPVSNAQYLCFIEAGGYEDPAHWDEDGRAWLAEHPVRAPDHWRQDDRGWWYGIDQDGPHDLAPDLPVHGLCHHEARAFARFAGARLPHEHEWEVACRLGLMYDSGHVWEWCANSFFPYPGFKPFPDEAQSLTGFDGQHYTLRGGSRHTRRDLRRCSYRNFHTPEKRHVFAGLRLAW
ncbi:SUMF1/EgtB/PvdO family nonheme iron enzyme [Thioalkalivibrio sulfidiphilus]|uniref:SUMF1/EgtB/PvdO family nonheme iron enzyme n=1 Tax=Thioalkalivibrio sulfidiphilus TaxID=1033854 RepID=UPI00035ECAA9|nr:SUMF1/EgtB/PvdO family nonheme iron enzyme [Thioalkalivibrio sulfidiphilus]